MGVLKPTLEITSVTYELTLNIKLKNIKIHYKQFIGWELTCSFTFRHSFFFMILYLSTTAQNKRLPTFIVQVLPPLQGSFPGETLWCNLYWQYTQPYTIVLFNWLQNTHRYYILNRICCVVPLRTETTFNCKFVDRAQPLNRQIHHSLFRTVLILVIIGWTPPSPSDGWSLSPPLSSAGRIFFGTGMPSSSRASTSLSNSSWKSQWLGRGETDGSQVYRNFLCFNWEETSPDVMN